MKLIDKKSVVITGVSSGIGYGASVEFINRGYHVFGSVRKQEDAKRLAQEFGAAFEPLIFDLTDPKAIESEAKRVEALLKGKLLVGLINNAGETQGGPLMHIPLEKVKESIEVLLLGQLAVTQAFLPLLGASQSNEEKPGRILMISSTSGKNAFPFAGPYAASKHALEGLSKSLRAELLMYGIKVVVIGPGGIKTPIWNKQGEDIIRQYKETDYYDPMKKAQETIKEMVSKDALELETFSKRLVTIFEKSSPKSRYSIVKKPFKHWLINHALPTRWRNTIIARKLGLLS